MIRTKKLQKISAFILILAVILISAILLTAVICSTFFAAKRKNNQIAGLAVKTTDTMLNEGQILTKSMLKKSLKVTARYKNGKIKKKYTLYNSRQIGRIIKPISSGKNKDNYKVDLFSGLTKRTVYIRVNRIEKIYFKHPKLKALTEGEKFDMEAFKKDYTVYAQYKKGADKKLTTYTVNAPDVVKANTNGRFTVTITYGKNTATISIPVTQPAMENSTTEDYLSKTVDKELHTIPRKSAHPTQHFRPYSQMFLYQRNIPANHCEPSVQIHREAL
ncbi:MAG: bacterial Ig-like domain-containing protein [Lachnospiraceae bacterium]|nr:bacterial Ig-like domain-containing protein [Lachnospiraceae bacterium]